MKINIIGCYQYMETGNQLKKKKIIVKIDENKYDRLLQVWLWF